jgi:hypothetical protein
VKKEKSPGKAEQEGEYPNPEMNDLFLDDFSFGEVRRANRLDTKIKIKFEN